MSIPTTGQQTRFITPPHVSRRGACVLFVNPGSAGTRRRFGGPLTTAFLTVAEGKAQAQIIILQD